MIEWSYPNLATPTTQDVQGTTAPTGGIRYMQWKIDTATWDVALPMRYVYGAEAVVQRMRIRFKFWKGEWFLDQRIGTPYRERVLVKSPEVPVVSHVFREVAQKTPGVATIERFKADFQRRERRIVLDFSAKLTDGALVIATQEPFIIAGI